MYSTVMKMGYRVVLALADTKRAGTLVMVRKPLDQTAVRGVRFHFPGQEPRYEEEGRIILLDFDEFSVLGTYVPNHGYTPDSFARCVSFFVFCWNSFFFGFWFCFGTCAVTRP